MAVLVVWGSPRCYCQLRWFILIKSHLKQGSRRIGRIDLNKRKNIGETLTVPIRYYCVAIMDMVASPVGSHALDAGGVQIRGLPSDLVQVGSHQQCGNWNILERNLRQICCKVGNVRSVARGNLNIRITLRQHILDYM